MENLVYLFVIVLVYSILNIIWNIYKLKKRGGDFFAAFSHRSTNKISGVTVFILGSIANLLLFDILTSVIFQLILIIILIRALQDINVYENGVFLNGYFIPWEKISSVKDWGEAKIEIKYGWNKVVILNNIKNKAKLFNIIKAHVDRNSSLKKNRY